MEPGTRTPEYFKKTNLKVGVVGCGYVGLPLVLRFAEHEHFVWSKQCDCAKRFIEPAGEINTHMPYHVVERIVEALNDLEKGLKGARILVLGAAYKRDVDDVRESPALKIMELLMERGAQVDYHDPYVPALHKMRHYDYSQMRSVPLTPKNLSLADCVVIVTDHSAYAYQMIAKHAPLLLDTRNATRAVTSHRDMIVLC
jgi:UDP-N-acetyl-D-glucosamine dehydrogenase